MSNRAIDLMGQRFGRLIVLERDYTPRSSRATYWVCRCDCGTVKAIAGYGLKRDTVSCGCYNSEIHTRHGHNKKPGEQSPTYNTWAMMHQRCYNTKHVAYDRYGGRGITVCQRWDDFCNFLEDMGERPEGLTLDRWPDNNGNYEPNNCRWATKSQQQYNRR